MVNFDPFFEAFFQNRSELEGARRVSAGPEKRPKKGVKNGQILAKIGQNLAKIWLFWPIFGQTRVTPEDVNFGGSQF